MHSVKAVLGSQVCVVRGGGHQEGSLRCSSRMLLLLAASRCMLCVADDG